VCVGVFPAPLIWWLKLSHVLYLLIMCEVYCDSVVDPGFLMGLRAVFFMSCPAGPSQSAIGVLQHTPSKSPVDIHFSIYFPLFLGEGGGFVGCDQ
jgi:hypothetical protein